MLSRLVITFLPRSKHLSISWVQSPSAVILEPPKIKSATVSRVFAMKLMGLDAMIGIVFNLYIALSTKIHLVKAMAFPVVMYGYESRTIKKAECQRIGAFEL